MRSSAVILAAGDFPRKGGEAWKLLARATHVICCDGAASAYCRHFRRSPTAVVGDMDSIRVMPEGSDQVRIPDQDTNDLAKAVAYCRKKGWRSPVIVGATGKREDHTLGNIFRAMEYGLDIVTDYGRFTCVCGSRRLRVGKGTPISIFATDLKTKMTSCGLVWPLDGIRFGNLYCATLNRAASATVVLTSDRPVYVFYGIA